ncbi:hypothetical protein BCCGELA001_05320 [Bradyrhizobium sp. CCGE-LA001]|nr:hypothetical protein BCCGELA001_05320 [Bradyrhizobium sp. CCGE-LA001]
MEIRKLIFRNDALDVPGLALDTISNSSIGLDRHVLYDRVDHLRFSCSASLRTLRLVANLFI